MITIEDVYFNDEIQIETIMLFVKRYMLYYQSGLLAIALVVVVITLIVSICIISNHVVRPILELTDVI